MYVLMCLLISFSDTIVFLKVTVAETLAVSPEHQGANVCLE